MLIQQVGKVLLGFGLVIAAIGAIVWGLGSQRWLRIGRLPGDFLYQKSGLTLFFPLTTMILLSLVLTAIMWVVGHFRR